MTILLNIVIVLITFTLTEFSAWANHKFIMHGSMWFFHSDHHKKTIRVGLNATMCFS